MVLLFKAAKDTTERSSGKQQNGGSWTTEQHLLFQNQKPGTMVRFFSETAPFKTVCFRRTRRTTLFLKNPIKPGVVFWAVLQPFWAVLGARRNEPLFFEQEKEGGSFLGILRARRIRCVSEKNRSTRRRTTTLLVVSCKLLQLTTYNSQFTAHHFLCFRNTNSQLTIHNSQFTIHNAQLTVLLFVSCELWKQKLLLVKYWITRK